MKWDLVAVPGLIEQKTSTDYIGAVHQTQRIYGSIRNFLYKICSRKQPLHNIWVPIFKNI